MHSSMQVVSTDLNFSQALDLIKKGNRLARASWNGKGMFVYLVPGSQFEVNAQTTIGVFPRGTIVNYHAHIDMKTAQGYVVPWVASQADMLADDWVLLV